MLTPSLPAEIRNEAAEVFFHQFEAFQFAVCAYLAIHYCDKLLLIAYILHTLILNCEICVFFFFFQTLLCFFEADHIEMWNPVAPIASFWEIRLEKTQKTAQDTFTCVCLTN